MDESRIQLEVQSSGVVELRAVLVDPSAVHAVFKVALLDPVLEKRRTRTETINRRGKTDELYVRDVTLLETVSLSNASARYDMIQILYALLHPPPHRKPEVKILTCICWLLKGP